LLDVEQKLLAIEALSPKFKVELLMRKPGDWYCSHGLSIGTSGYSSSCGGDGKNPFDAIIDAFERLTKIEKKDEAVIVSRPGQPDRFFRWNGFMWAEVEMPKHE